MPVPILDADSLYAQIQPQGMTVIGIVQTILVYRRRQAPEEFRPVDQVDLGSPTFA